MLKNKDILRELWNIKKSNIHIIGSQRKRKGMKNYLKEKWLKTSLGKETDIQIQEAQRTLNKRNPNRHILACTPQPLSLHSSALEPQPLSPCSLSCSGNKRSCCSEKSLHCNWRKPVHSNINK